MERIARIINPRARASGPSLPGQRECFARAGLGRRTNRLDGTSPGASLARNCILDGGAKQLNP